MCVCVCVPVDAMAHARDESGQEHEGLPVRTLFTGDATDVAVGAAVALRHSGGIKRYKRLSVVTVTSSLPP